MFIPYFLYLVNANALPKTSDFIYLSRNKNTGYKKRPGGRLLKLT